jgi:hypothetical protein
MEKRVKKKLSIGRAKLNVSASLSKEIQRGSVDT